MTLLALAILAAAPAGDTAVTRSADAALARRTPAATVCAPVRVQAPGLGTHPRDLRFSSREVLDLQFRARLRQNLQGDHVLRLKVFTPRGFLYQEIAVPFVGALPSPDRAERLARARTGAAARAPGPPPPRLLEGYPRPLPVQRLSPVRGDRTALTQYELTARLPVAGTSITTSSLYGRWSVEPYLDGEAAACGPAARFTIRE